MKLLLLLFFPWLLFAQTKQSIVATDSIAFYYETGAYELSKSQVKLLKNKLGTFDSISQIEIHGYTDFVGTKTANMKLSRKRSETMKELFVALNHNDVAAFFYGEIDFTGASPVSNVREHRKVVCYLHYVRFVAPQEVPKQIPSLKTLAKAEIGVTIVLKQLQFILGKAELVPNAYQDLVQLLNTLKAHPEIKIKIIGHVCCGRTKEVGSEHFSDYNLRLSSERAFTVYQYLVINGIDKNRLSYQGMGFKTPLKFPERNNSDKYLNRRIEVELVAK